MTRNQNLTAGRQGFTLIELLVYIAIFAVVAGILTTIFYLIINSQKKQSISGEVTQQLNFVLGTVQRFVGESSLVEAVYEGSNPSSTCATFCTLKLRRTDPTKDPTIIRSDVAGIYIKEGNSDEVALTNNKVIIDNLKFTKNEIPGGHAVIEINTSLTYNTANPRFAVTKAIKSAIARVSAATFDSDLLPNLDATSDIGQTSARWKNGRFSGDLTIGGNVGIGTTATISKLVVSTTTSLDGIHVTDGTRWLKIMPGTVGGSSYNPIVQANDLAIIYSNNAPGTGNFVIAPWSAAISGLRMDASGNVGIGTTSPGGKLHVVGQTRISGNSAARLTIEPEGGTTNLWNLDNQAGVLRIFRENYNGTNGAVRMVITDTGDVGIGTQGKGVILRATSGANCYRVTVDSTGVLSTALVTCP
ncbi:MAG: prepilin-type N-terminal cleavage/methylation domain-containing protein [Candidatus Colwellbacteria bacterium]|nr:prepilin-type N-terminal cleavage/methylation domain-containing protein [Candidatus Colwellbacteria bacterium]